MYLQMGTERIQSGYENAKGTSTEWIQITDRKKGKNAFSRRQTTCIRQGILQNSCLDASTL